MRACKPILLTGRWIKGDQSIGWSPYFLLQLLHIIYRL